MKITYNHILSIALISFTPPDLCKTIFLFFSYASHYFAKKEEHLNLFESSGLKTSSIESP